MADEKPIVQIISGVAYLQHTWWYQIKPPLSGTGDRIEFTTNLRTNGKNKDAFQRKGTQFFAVAQRNVVRLALKLTTSVKGVRFDLLDFHALNGNTTIRLRREQWPRLADDGSTIFWDVVHPRPGNYVLSYRLSKRPSEKRRRSSS